MPAVRASDSQCFQAELQYQQFTRLCHGWYFAGATETSALVSKILAAEFWSADQQHALITIVTGRVLTGDPQSAPDRSDGGATAQRRTWKGKMQQFDELVNWMPATFWKYFAEQAGQEGGIDTAAMGGLFMEKAMQLGCRHPREYMFRNCAACEATLMGREFTLARATVLTDNALQGSRPHPRGLGTAGRYDPALRAPRHDARPAVPCNPVSPGNLQRLQRHLRAPTRSR